MRNLTLSALLLAVVSLPSLAEEDLDRAAYEVLRDAKHGAQSTVDQARILARYAWLMPEQPRRVRTMARANLLGYADEGIAALNEVFDQVDPTLQWDVTAAIIECQLAQRGAPPNQYFDALERVLWNGTSVARRLTMYPLSTFRWKPAMIPLMDTAFEYPALRPTTIETLRDYADVRSILFLREVLATGSPEERELATWSLQTIVPAGTATLRDFLAHRDPLSRTLAAKALLPIATEDDLAAFYEYLEAFGESDESAVVASVQRRVEQLEARIREELADELAEEAINAGN